MTSVIVISGARKIAQVIGSNRNEIAGLVATGGLPAWRETETGPWKALREDLVEWARNRRNTYLQKVVKC